MISYKKLFLLMEEQEITKEKLKNKIGISSATMAKLSKNEDVSMSTIQSLCDFFDCQPGAILSYEKEIAASTASAVRSVWPRGPQATATSIMRAARSRT